MNEETMGEAQAVLKDETDDLFYFESDHLALKGNREYSELLKTIFILEAQRTKAIEDYNKVTELQKEVLEDPFSLIQKLKNGEDLGIPDIQQIVEIPTIHWSKYNVPLPQEALKFINANKKHSNNESANFAVVERDIVAKSGTYNKPWSTEEQKKLEELLILYPPEAVEFQRYKKIAAALGNRTVKQVSSRIQKYFLKLYKAGLPVPGRIPKSAERTKRSKLHSHQRHNHYLIKPTTFFPEWDIPVVMNESEQIPGPSKEGSSNSNFSNYLIPDSSHINQPQQPEYSVSDVDLQLQLLKSIKIDKQNENDNEQSPALHLGYKCDYCDESPIRGTRWNCQMCKEESIDFCSDCVVSQLYSDTPHPLSHKLEPIHFDEHSSKTNTIDENYSSSESGSIYESSNMNPGSSNEIGSSDSENDYQPANLEETSEHENSNEDEEEEEEGGVSNTVYDNVIIGNCEDKLTSSYEVYESKNYDDEIEIKETEENEPNYSESEIFTDTQNVAYDYLHSSLLLDNDTTD